MTAVLSPTSLLELYAPPPEPSLEPPSPDALQTVYNKIALAGLSTLDRLRWQPAAVTTEELQRLAFFAYSAAEGIDAETNNRRIEHARESFLIGIALRAGQLDRLEEIVGASSTEHGVTERREVARFGGGAVLEAVLFDNDTVVDERNVVGNGRAIGFTYSYVQGLDQS